MKGIIFLASFVMLLQFAALASAESVKLNLDDVVINTTQEIVYNVSLTSQVSIYAMQFSITFDNTILQASLIDGDSCLKTPGTTTYLRKDIDGRTISYAETKIGSPDITNCSGTILRMKFKPLKTGTSSIELSSLRVLDSNLAPINSTEIKRGSLTVKEENQESPPVVAPTSGGGATRRTKDTKNEGVYSEGQDDRSKNNSESIASKTKRLSGIIAGNIVKPSALNTFLKDNPLLIFTVGLALIGLTLVGLLFHKKYHRKKTK